MHTAVWTSKCGAYSVQHTLSDTDRMCFIFHEPGGSVRVADIPTVWETSSGPVHTTELPCGHTYSVAALAIHFLSRDMRCPVCRAGHAGVMSLDSLPVSVRMAFAEKTASMHDASDGGSETSSHVPWGIMPEEIANDIRLTAEVGSLYAEGQIDNHMHFVHALSTTRLYRDHRQLENGDLHQYESMRHFRRQLDTFVCRNKRHTDVYLRFYIDHPLFHTVLSSDKVILAEMVSGYTFEMRTPDCAAVALVRYQFSLDGTHLFEVQVRTDHVVQRCLHSIHATLTGTLQQGQ